MTARVEALLAAITLIAAPFAAWRWGQGVSAPAGQAAQMERVAVLPAPYDEDSLDIAFESVVHENPFRLSRMPSDIPYSPGAVAVPQTAQRFAPPLVLRGIVGGPPWQAVIDGIPGSPAGTVVTSGSVFDKLTIRSVTRDSVFVQTADTAWYLTLVKGSE